MMAAATPSPLWFATRGAGTATLLLLTAVVALGIVTAGSEARSRVWPRFVSAELHRNLSLFAVAPRSRWTPGGTRTAPAFRLIRTLCHPGIGFTVRWSAGPSLARISKSSV